MNKPKFYILSLIFFGSPRGRGKSFWFMFDMFGSCFSSIFSADTNFLATLTELTEESQKRLRYEPEGIEGLFGREIEAEKPLQNP